MDLLHHFSSDISGIKSPAKFTFPFYYEPHPLALVAAEEVQNELRQKLDWEHNFGFDKKAEGLAIGKMFGVLVVRTKRGRLGYLKAFSGKLANKNHHVGYVPPVFDMLTDGSFFLKGEEILNSINRRIEELEQDKAYLQAKETFKKVESEVESTLQAGRQKIKAGKKSRKKIRKEAIESLSPSEYETLIERLKEESIRANYIYRDLAKEYQRKLSEAENHLASYQAEIDNLKAERKTKSGILQKQLFENYTFLNALKEKKSLLSIFQNTINSTPPAGAGECAAPKLLQYAFANDLEPIALAEFWWGKSPSAEVRKSGNFYPACRGKCEPILGHMLSATITDPNPMLVNPALGKKIKILYQDDAFAVIVKPAEFLSVPGKTIKDSVLSRVKSIFPKASGPMIVHRLDMSTSGLMIIALNPDSYKKIQRQFINRSVKKTYIALLDGSLKEESGLIDLPLRVDLNDRPRQLVCYEYGKEARTKFQVLERSKNTTRIEFHPITGRTHQLRVHSAHFEGLGMPIIGDDLYGQKGQRLHLHAARIAFIHPNTREEVSFNSAPDF